MMLEGTAVYLTAIGTAGTVFNVWLNTKIKADVLELKNWVLTNFITKDDLPTHLEPLRNLVQLRQSEERLRKL